MNFRNASARCKAWGGYLASWNTAEEQLAVGGAGEAAAEGQKVLSQSEGNRTICFLLHLPS